MRVFIIMARRCLHCFRFRHSQVNNKSIKVKSATRSGRDKGTGLSKDNGRVDAQQISDFEKVVCFSAS